MEIKRYSFQQHGDDRGMLVALEELKDIPFSVRRIYYIYDTLAGVRRGFHAHKNLKQILVCVKGSCKLHLDNGFETEEVLLDKPYEGIYLDNNIWREMYDFSEDAVLLVLASEYYDEADYIRDYQKFLEFVNAGGK
ncbi:MAG: WxcM-like domain-containing protein [Clostridia bacterium]|nr:WxcM-like domain-containing protein [Clostridia bacterium]